MTVVVYGVIQIDSSVENRYNDSKIYCNQWLRHVFARDGVNHRGRAFPGFSA
ncbi:hypothetical protein [Melghirimyces algeriensis]|uniref:hypothetical protein n=1 Tax=Melghirimyces algeriensis TaxID=910412 RepID=UPI00163D6393|nr:hypothetical protein [Melghirimyces algeriensis]